MRIYTFLLWCALLLAACGEGSGSPTAVPPLGAGRITSGFGMRDHHPIRRDSGPVHHDGYDLAAPAGSPIFAARDGRVVFAGYRGGYGLMVELRHEGGFATRYAHARSLNVRAGQVVQGGEILGFVGSTGLSTGPHLHYEVRYHGKPIDPRDAGFALASHELREPALSRVALASAPGGRNGGMGTETASNRPGSRQGRGKAVAARPGMARVNANRAIAPRAGAVRDAANRAIAPRAGAVRDAANRAIAPRPGAGAFRAGNPENAGSKPSRLAEMLLKHSPANRVD